METDKNNLEVFLFLYEPKLVNIKFYIPINVHAIYIINMKIDTRCYSNKTKH